MLIKLLLLITIYTELLLALSVYLQNPKDSGHRIFALLNLSAATWTFANYLTDKLSSIFWLNCTYSLGSIVICLGLIWALITCKVALNLFRAFIIIFVSLIFSFYSLQPGFIQQETITGGIGWGLPIYGIYYIFYSFLIVITLYNTLKHSTEKSQDKQYRFVLAGAIISLTTTAITSIVFPFFAFHVPSTIDHIGFLFFLTVISFSIFKYQLFSIKVIFIEIIFSVILIFFLTRLAMTQNLGDLLSESFLFVITLILGLILIKNIHQNLRQRSEIEQLINDRKSTFDSLNNYK